MPRYFFHVEDSRVDRDGEGMELADLAKAKCEAVEYAGKLICEHASEFWNHDGWRMTVADDTGLTLFELHLFGTEAPAAARRDPAFSAARTSAFHE
jgi:hypothetical protein